MSFSSIERDLFIAMPAAMKQGYMLTKVLVHDCITVNDIPSGVCSYNLKTATFECFKSEISNWEDLAIRPHKTLTARGEGQAKPADVVRYAQKILERVEHSFVQKHQDSFFLKGCDLMVHSIDKNDYRQMLYVMYCAALLSDTDKAPWLQLAECVAQQLLKSENMHKGCFVPEIETLLDMGLKSEKNLNDILVNMIQLGQVEGVGMMLERGTSAAGIKVDRGEDHEDLTALEFAQVLLDDTATATTTGMVQFLKDNLIGKLMLFF